MADTIAKVIERSGDNFEGKIITDFIPGNFAIGLGEGKHADPCPTDTHGLNEWVLNHLPFGSEEQKKKFLDDLIKDQKIEESRRKREERIQKIKKEGVVTRTDSTRAKISIKESTKKS